MDTYINLDDRDDCVFVNNFTILIFPQFNKSCVSDIFSWPFFGKGQYDFPNFYTWDFMKNPIATENINFLDLSTPGDDDFRFFLPMSSN